MSLYGPFLEVEDLFPIYKRKFLKTYSKIIISSFIPGVSFLIIADHISYIDGQQLERMGIKRILFTYFSISVLLSLFVTFAFTKPKPQYLLQHLNRKMKEKEEKEETYKLLNTKELQKFSKLNK